MEPAHPFVFDLLAELRQFESDQLGARHQGNHPVGTGQPQLIECQGQWHLLGAGARGQQQLTIDTGNLKAPEGVIRVHGGSSRGGRRAAAGEWRQG